jgi:Fuc2NAc and GlcNAc transferase
VSAVALVAGVFLSAWLFTRLYLEVARGRLVDVPGQRSSHLRPTPTGGGAGPVLAIVAGVSLLPGVGTDWRIVTALAAALAVLGFLDDLRGLGVRTRLLAQTVAAAVAVAATGSPAVTAAGFAGLAGACVLVPALVWLVNAFNFMDGIDGLAAGQALFMASAAALLAREGSPDTPMVMLCVAAGAGGFLVLNWHPARLFMGDTGSLAVGILLAAAVPVTWARAEIGPATWLILWAPFLADTVLTLLHRAWRRHRLHEGHRQHAYQRLARAWGSHARVTLVVLAVDLLWLLPLALLAGRDPARAPILAAIALLPLLAAVGWVLRRCP